MVWVSRLPTKLLKHLGLPADHPSRIEAGIVFALNETINEGHVYAPQELLAQRAVELLEVPPELIPPALERLAQEDRIRPEMIPLDNNKKATSQAISESSNPIWYTGDLFDPALLWRAGRCRAHQSAGGHNL